MYKYKHREARNQCHVAQNDRAGGNSNHKDSWIIKCKLGFIKKKQKQKWRKPNKGGTKRAIIFAFYQRQNNDSENVIVR